MLTQGPDQQEGLAAIAGKTHNVSLLYFYHDFWISSQILAKFVQKYLHTFFYKLLSFPTKYIKLVSFITTVCMYVKSDTARSNKKAPNLEMGPTLFWETTDEF